MKCPKCGTKMSVMEYDEYNGIEWVYWHCTNCNEIVYESFDLMTGESLDD